MSLTVILGYLTRYVCSSFIFLSLFSQVKQHLLTEMLKSISLLMTDFLWLSSFHIFLKNSLIYLVESGNKELQAWHDSWTRQLVSLLLLQLWSNDICCSLDPRDHPTSFLPPHNDSCLSLFSGYGHLLRMGRCEY